MEERHTAANLVSRMEELFSYWKIDEKVMAVVTDNVINIVNATHLLQQVTEKFDLTLLTVSN